LVIPSKIRLVIPSNNDLTIL